jgi:hypothetical protein
LFAAVVIVLLLTAIFPFAATAQEENWLPPPTGPYQVGTAFYHWVDEAREEMFTDDPNDRRELVVQVWYPAGVEVGATPAPYFPHGEADVRGFETSHQDDPYVGSAPVAEFAQTPTHSYLDAPVSSAQPSYPVLIHTAFPTFFTARIQDLASYGYIVASIYPPYLWGWTVFPDGREVTSLPGRKIFGMIDTVVDVAAQDQVFVLDQLEMLNEGPAEEQFSGRLELDHVGTFGDSWGSWVTMVASLKDSRFKAALPCVSHGYIPTLVIIEGLDLPIMFIDAEGEPSSFALSRMRGPAYMLTLNGISSFNVVDFALWPGMGGTPLADELGDVEPTRAMQTVNAYAMAFFDRYLMGEEAPLLDGPSPDYPEVEIETRNIQD